MTSTRVITRSSALRRTQRPLRVLPFGHSIIAGDKDTTSPNFIMSSGFAEQGVVRASRPYVMIGNAGVPGETVQSIEARLPAVIEAAPDVVPLMAMTNNLVSGMNSAAWVAALNSYERIIVGLLSAGILPVICTDPPKNSAAAEAKLLQPYLYMVAEYYGVPVADCYRTVVNAQNGNWIVGKTSDNTHPNPSGADLMAAPLAAVLADPLNSIAPVYMAAVSEAGLNAEANLIRNGGFAQQSVAGVPDAWTTNTSAGTRTATTPATLPYTGVDFQYQLTSGSVAFALSGANVTGFSPGDVMRFSGRVNQTGVSLTGSGSTQAFLQGSSGVVRPLTGDVFNGDQRFSVEFVVPAGVTTYTPSVTMSQNGTITVNNLTLINLTALKARWQPGQQSI